VIACGIDTFISKGIKKAVISKVIKKAAKNVDQTKLIERD
jgi:hypothetical protein